MHFRMLGPLMINSKKGVVRVSGARQRKLLVALLLEANRSVSVDRLTDVLWDTNPPITAVEQVQNCAGWLRRLFDSSDNAVAITRKPSAYVLHIDEGRVDVHAFRRMVDEARRHEAKGAVAEATEKLRQAIGLWYGNPFEDVLSDALRGHATWLEELRVQAVQRYAELEIMSGNHGDVIAQLTTWTEAYPFNEALCGQLMQALHDSGRTADALDLYRRTWSRFVAELGLEPGEKLRALHQTIITSTRTEGVVVEASDGEVASAMRLLQRATSMLGEAVQLLATHHQPGSGASGKSQRGTT